MTQIETSDGSPVLGLDGEYARFLEDEVHARMGLAALASAIPDRSARRCG
jgi:hypothetical protein